MTDFEFGGQYLSDFGCVVVFAETEFDNSISLGSSLSFEKVTNNNSFKNNIITYSYEDVLTATFDIIKDPCKYDSDFNFTDEEIRNIMTWLNRKQYYKFKPIYNDGSFADLYYNGTFDSIKCIYSGEKAIGFTLNFLADSPWGYGEPIVSKGTKLVLHDDSDEIGYLYPTKFVITCKNNGTVSIGNLNDNSSLRRTKIENCISGEVITLDCENKIITSSIVHSKLYNDFNYIFPRLVRTYTSTKNVFEDELDSILEITYSPIRKVGVML